MKNLIWANHRCNQKCSHIMSLCSAINYRPPTKLQESNVFSSICPSVFLSLGGPCTGNWPWSSFLPIVHRPPPLVYGLPPYRHIKLGPHCAVPPRPPIPKTFKLVHYEARPVEDFFIHVFSDFQLALLLDWCKMAEQFISFTMEINNRFALIVVEKLLTGECCFHACCHNQQ